MADQDMDVERPESVAPLSPPGSPPLDDDEGDDLLENMAEDYRAISELDEYEQDGIDNAEYENSRAARRRADRALDARWGRSRQQRRRRAALFPQSLLDDEDEDISAAIPLAQRLKEMRLAAEGEDAEDFEEAMVNLEDFQGPLRDWVQEERVQREVQRCFRRFLTEYKDENGREVYPRKIDKMCRDNLNSLDVSYSHLSHSYPILAIWLTDVPKTILDLFDDVAMQVALYEFKGYDLIHDHIHVRIADLPLLDNLRDLRQIHLNALIKVSGVVTRRTNKFPQLNSVKYDCAKCGYVCGPFIQDRANEEITPPSCPDCQSKGPFLVNSTQTHYRNYQKVTLQESPGTVPAGRIPRSREVILIEDMCDTVRPGEEVSVTGIYVNMFEASLNVQSGFPVFSTVIEANYIDKSQDMFTKYEVTEEDRKLIRDLSKLPNIEQIIVNSIAPSIYGHEYIKRAIAFALFAGMEKQNKNKHRVRGDINILILGDPGLGKSQFLKYVEKVAFRAVYATGKGASAVGLTASVRRDPVTREWTLEGGALVLADRGICLIDEFDKMNDQDRTSIHEAMEQQSISISKAGIITTLQARCSVIAAANPIKGRYDGSLTFVENVDLTDPILSRFDILAVVRDLIDPVRDEALANFVVGNHMKSHPEYILREETERDEAELKGQEEKFEITPDLTSLPQDLLRKYILYAKKHCKPSLRNINKAKIASFYADLRNKSMEGGGIPIAVRHIESMLRMSEARAKMHLRDNVNEDDVDVGIRTLLESFIDTQKQQIKTSLRHEFRSYLMRNRDHLELLMHLLEKEVQQQAIFLGSDEMMDIPVKDFQAKAADYDIHDLTPFFGSGRFREAGFIVDQRAKVIKRVFGSAGAAAGDDARQ